MFAVRIRKPQRKTRLLSADRNQLGLFRSPEALGSRKNPNCFEQVGLSLAVFAVDDIDPAAGSPVDLPQVAEGLNRELGDLQGV